MELVSVVIPTYNRLLFLKNTVASILKQTYRCIEVLIVGDGHQPEVERYISCLSDNRVRYLFCDHCGFPAKPRNMGIKESKGIYIAFCDDDDLWHEDKLIEQISVMEEKNYHFCFTKVNYIDTFGERINKKHSIKPYYRGMGYRSLFMSGGYICNSSVVISRKIIDTVGLLSEDPKLKSMEDFHYWVKALRYFKACYIDKPLTEYRYQNADSIQTNDNIKQYKNQLYLMRSINKDINIDKTIYALKFLKVTVKFLLREALEKAKLWINLSALLH